MLKEIPHLKFLLITILISYRITPSQTELARVFDEHYYPYCQTALTELRIETVATHLQDLKNRFPSSFIYRQIGSSVQNRPIYLVEMGRGATTVLLWSQMHGDEPTATAALLDIFNFLLEHRDETYVWMMLDNLKIIAVPMLNPDGAAANSRRNAQGLDINRDARDRSTPEGQLLYQLKEQFQPVFGFNLHDQNGRLTTANTNRQVALALMAPPFDNQDSDSPSRTRAKQLVVYLAQALEPQIGGHIARYSDEYMPRAFGDAMQSWGVSTILIESGGWHENRDHFLQRLNFTSILTALAAIASKDYEKVDPGQYQALPLNDKELFDLVIADVMVVDGTGIPPFKADVAINFHEENNERVGTIADLGDLNGFTALDTIDGSNCYLMPGMLALIPGNLLTKRNNAQELKAWLKQGFTTIILTLPFDEKTSFSQWQKRIDDLDFAGKIGVMTELKHSLRTTTDSLRVLDWLRQGAIGLIANDSLIRGLHLAEWVGKPVIVLADDWRSNQLLGLQPTAVRELTSRRFAALGFERRGKIRPGQIADCVLFSIEADGAMRIRQVFVKGEKVQD